MGAEIETSFGTTSDEDEYDWDRLASEERGSIAPQNIFNQPDYVPKNEFIRGHIIMAHDRNFRADGLYYLAQIDKVYKCFVRVKLIEVNRTFWTICDSDIMMPFNEKKLKRHPDNPKTDKAYAKWLAKYMSENNEKIAPGSIISTKLIYGPSTNFFAVGMVFAFLDDHTFTGKLSPAIVTKINQGNDYITLVRADRGSKTEIEILYYDRRMFPIEFAKRARIPIRSGSRWKQNTKGEIVCKIPIRPIKPIRGKIVKDLKKKRGRPKKKEKGEKLINDNDLTFESVRPASPSIFNTSGRASIYSELDASFYPRTSTPLRIGNKYNKSIYADSLNGSNDDESNSTFSSLFDPDYEGRRTSSSNNIISTQKTSSISSSTISSQSQLLAKQINVTAKRLQKEEENCAVITNNSPISMTSPCNGSSKSLMKELQENWLNSYQRSNNMDTGLSKMVPSTCQELCVPRINNLAEEGNFLNRNTLAKEIAALPPTHYKMQFYNIIVALSKSASAGNTIFDKFAYNVRGNEEYFTIYNKINGIIISKRFPSPKNFAFACGWLKFFLKQVNADEELITLTEM